MRTPALWLIWVLVVFGAMNIYAPPNPDLLGDFKPGAAGHPASAAGKLLLLMRDEGDTRRYFAFASATLGRKYDAYFMSADDAKTKPGPENHVVVTPDRPQIPYRDFAVEYPPGMLVAAILPALFTAEFPTYHFLFSILMELLLTAGAWLAARAAEKLRPGAGGDALLLSILFVAADGVTAVRRYDALVALTIAAALYGMVARRPALAGFGLGAGAIVKGTPILLAPVGAIFAGRAGRWRELAIAGATCAALGAVAAAVYVGVAGPQAFATFAYHLDRPVQIESPYGAALVLAGIFQRGLFHVVSSFGSENVSSTWEPFLRQLASATLALALVAILVWLWRVLGRASDDFARVLATLAAATATLAAFIGLGKVFSPQYMIWLLPSGVIAAALGSERSRVLLIGAAMATQLEFPFIYQLDTPWLVQSVAAIALIRDALLIGCAVSLMADASRATTARS